MLYKWRWQFCSWRKVFPCGDVCALLLLHHFGCDNNLTEWDLAKALRSMTNRSISDAKPGSAQDFADYGTHLEDLYNYFYKHPQLKIVASSYRLKYANSDIVKSGDPFPQCDYGNLYPTFQSINAFSACFPCFKPHRTDQ